MMMAAGAVTGEGAPSAMSIVLPSSATEEGAQDVRSRSGNVLDTARSLHLIDEFGADALRFTLTSMAAHEARDLKLSKDRIAGYHQLRARSCGTPPRFAEMNDCKPVPGF